MIGLGHGAGTRPAKRTNYGMNPDHLGLIEATARRFWKRLGDIAPDHYGLDDFEGDLALVYAKAKGEIQDDNDLAPIFVTRADQFTKDRIKAFLADLRMEPPGRTKADIPMLEFKRLAKTMTNRQLAKKYGCTARTIINRKREWGLI